MMMMMQLVPANYLKFKFPALQTSTLFSISCWLNTSLSAALVRMTWHSWSLLPPGFSFYIWVSGKGTHWVCPPFFLISSTSSSSPPPQPLTSGLRLQISPLFYTHSLGHLIQAHGFKFSLYVEDSKMYISRSDLSLLDSRFMIPTDTNQPFQYRHLKVNMTKIEFLSFLPNLLFLPLFPISVNTPNIIPVVQTKNPGTFSLFLPFRSQSISKLHWLCL